MSHLFWQSFPRKKPAKFHFKWCSVKSSKWKVFSQNRHSISSLFLPRLPSLSRNKHFAAIPILQVPGNGVSFLKQLVGSTHRGSRLRRSLKNWNNLGSWTYPTKPLANCASFSFWTKLFHWASGLEIHSTLPSSLIWNFKKSLLDKETLCFEVDETIVLSFQPFNFRGAQRCQKKTNVDAKSKVPSSWTTHVACDSRNEFWKTYVGYLFAFVCIHPYVSVGNKEKKSAFCGL